MYNTQSAVDETVFELRGSLELQIKEAQSYNQEFGWCVGAILPNDAVTKRWDCMRVRTLVDPAWLYEDENETASSFEVIEEYKRSFGVVDGHIQGVEFENFKPEDFTYDDD